MANGLVSLSGGLDSAVTLAKALDECEEVKVVNFVYGSKHNSYEDAAAFKLTCHYKVERFRIDLCGVMQHFKSNLLKSGEAIPEGHYEAESMRQTVVPGRNLIFTSILAGLAESLGCQFLYLGVHAGDHFIYPDCRPHWVTAVRQALALQSEGRVALQAPFLHEDKSKIVERGFQLDVPFHLTRTCYKDQEVACGKCGSCQERLAAFAKLGQVDPLEYETRELIAK